MKGPLFREIQSLLYAINATAVPERQIQHFKEIEKLARKAYKELQSEKPLINGNCLTRIQK